MNPKLSSRARQQKEQIERAGGVVRTIRTTGRNHLRVEVQLADGSIRTLICSGSPSDHRTQRNTVALIKRWQAAAS